jgi:hypothetical protein
MMTDQLLLQAQLLWSRLATFLAHENKLHLARYAYPHELISLLSPSLDGAHLLLAEYINRHILRVATTPRQPRLGNMLLCGPTGSGKSQQITSQLLTGLSPNW